MTSVAPGADHPAALIADPGTLRALGLGVADLADAEERALAIRAEHPKLDAALRAGRVEVELDGRPVNARLHLAMHEIVATQLWDDDPPEVRRTAARLVAGGYERHEVLHMLASTITEQVWAAMVEGREYDDGRHLAALRALPESWERQREQPGGSQPLERMDEGSPGHRRSARGASRRPFREMRRRSQRR